MIRQRSIRLYVLAMAGAASIALALTPWHSITQLPHGSLGGWLALVAVGVFSEAVAIRLDVGKETGSSSIMFIPLLASVQLFGPASAVGLMVVTGAFGEVVRRKESIRAVFNIAQGIVATFAAGWAFTLFHGLPLELATAPAHLVYPTGQLLPFMAFGFVFLALNHAAVALAIAVSQHLRFAEIWADILGHPGASLHDLLVSPIAIAVAFMYMELNIAGILVVMLPLLFVRHAYATMLRLRDANRDLLNALIKAIETRDPYTSGHSLRVSELAREIAGLLGLPRTIVEKVQHAALLHDVGKIDAVYRDILMKPGSLSSEERAVIQSHVTKGEELLRNLSSVPDDVIKAVRHHHEREDGTGYPDGLRGAEIPLGAKIIAVCDAVDAMLSDRPYRAALSLPAVLEELTEQAGGQFDPRIVEALIASDVLAKYTHPAAPSQAASYVGSPMAPVPLTVRRASRRPRSDRLISRG